MKKLLFISGVILLCTAPARAQSDYPKAEVFGGYSYFSADIKISDPFDTSGDPFFQQREGFHGFAVSGAANLSRSFGVVADFSYHRKEFEVFGPNIRFTTFNFLFGPRVTARGHRVEAFAHGLVGGVRREIQDVGSSVDFALGAGGGVDVKVARNVAIRLFQADYIPFRDRDPFTGDKEWRHNLRVSTGVTFRFD